MGFNKKIFALQEEISRICIWLISIVTAKKLLLCLALVLSPSSLSEFGLIIFGKSMYWFYPKTMDYQDDLSMISL